MFEEVKTKVNGKLGCACICLKYPCGDEIRQNLIEAGKNCGFEKVEVIHLNIAIFCDIIVKSNFLPRNGFVFWVVHNHCFQVGKKDFKQINYYGVWSLRFASKEKLKALMKLSGMEEIPNVILLPPQSIRSAKDARNLFPNCSIICCENYGHSFNGIIAMARMLAGDAINTINFIPYPFRIVITITHDYVLIYETNDKKFTSFSSSTDYGSKVPKTGVNYLGPTVIKNDIRSFGTIPSNSIIPVREIIDGNYFKQYYVIKIGNFERQITIKTVIIDLFKEVIRRIKIEKEVIILTIPSHFSESQKELYLKAANMAGLNNFISVDEQISISYGCKALYNIQNETEFWLINFRDPKIEVALYNVQEFDNMYTSLKIFEYNEFENAKNAFFDDIILSARNPQRKKKVNFKKSLETLFAEMNLKDEPKLVVVTSDQFYYSLLCQYYPGFDFIFVEMPFDLIIKGASFA